MTPEERIARLTEAREMLLEASDIIEECIRMSGLGRRFGDLPDRIRALSESPSEDGLFNLIRESEHTEDDPEWTRPFDSPKNARTNL